MKALLTKIEKQHSFHRTLQVFPDSRDAFLVFCPKLKARNRDRLLP